MTRPEHSVYVICLYGLFDPRGRTPTEMQGYREYLVACAREVAAYPCDVTVILAGGRTTEINVTEAATAVHFFTETLGALGRRNCPVCNILQEDRSINAPQNILFSLKRIRELDIRTDRVVICSDAVRQYTTRVLAWQLLRGEYACPWKVLGFPRADTHPNSTWQRQLSFALAYLIHPKKVQVRLRAANRYR